MEENAIKREVGNYWRGAGIWWGLMGLFDANNSRRLHIAESLLRYIKES